MNGKTERIEIRLTAEGAQSLDEWRRGRIDHPSRAEAVCRLVEAGLGAQQSAGSESCLLYLAVQLLADVHAKLLDPDKDNPAFDAEFVSRMVGAGQLWALDWQYHFPFRWPEAPPAVQEVCDILEMFDLMELGFEALEPEQREALEEAGFRPFGGFDGNNEAEQTQIARILVDDLGRWERLKGRATGNTHFPVLGGYRRMLRAFDSSKASAQRNGRCTAAEISALLQARIHPENRR